MRGNRHFLAGCIGIAALIGAGSNAYANNDSHGGSGGNGRCMLHSDNNRILHVVYIQFDNVHFRRDIPNVPADLEQISNLRDFLVGNNLTDERNIVAQKMITLLEGAVFENKTVNEREAVLLILES